MAAALTLLLDLSALALVSVGCWVSVRWAWRRWGHLLMRVRQRPTAPDLWTPGELALMDAYAKGAITLEQLDDATTRLVRTEATGTRLQVSDAAWARRYCQPPSPPLVTSPTALVREANGDDRYLQLVNAYGEVVKIVGGETTDRVAHIAALGKLRSVGSRAAE